MMGDPTVVLALSVGGRAYANTASNTVPSSNARTGAGTVSGFTATTLRIQRDPPTSIDPLTFTISPVVPSTNFRSMGEWP